MQTDAMTMPRGFCYREVFLRGKPQHDKGDPFRLRHPCMDVGRRAKLFAPFDALRGFGEVIATQNIHYEDRVELNEEDSQELDRRLHILRSLTQAGCLTREHPVRITVTYFVPREEEKDKVFAPQGQYQTVEGICRGVDPVARLLWVDETGIAFCDLRCVESEEGIFSQEPA